MTNHILQYIARPILPTPETAVAQRRLNILERGQFAKQQETANQNAARTMLGKTVAVDGLQAGSQQAAEAGQFDMAADLDKLYSNKSKQELGQIQRGNDAFIRTILTMPEGISNEEYQARLRRVGEQNPAVKFGERITIDDLESTDSQELLTNFLPMADAIERRFPKPSAGFEAAQGGGEKFIKGGPQDPDTVRAKALAQDVTPEKGVNVIFPDGKRQTFRNDDPRLDEAFERGGTIIGQSIQAASAGGLTSNRADDIRADIGHISNARSMLADMRQSILDDPTRSGVLGFVRGKAQTLIGIASDVGDILGGAVTRTVTDTAKAVLDDITLGQSDPSRGADEEIASRFFDPKLPENEVFENSLAYALARARKGKGRLNLDDVKTAREVTKLTGLKSSQDVLAKLAAIDKEFENADKIAQGRLRGETGGDVPTFEVKDGRLVRIP